MHIKSFILIILFFVNHFYLYSQKDHFSFGHIDKSNGLSNNRVLSICKDSMGFMWFGTNYGLNRYDGYSIKVFKHNPDDSSSLLDNIAERLLLDPEGKLWIYTSSGICIYNPEYETFTPAYRIHYTPIPAQNIIDIRKDGKGNIWYLGTNNYGLYKYDVKKDSAFRIVRIEENDSTLHSYNIASIDFDSDDNLWLVYRDGIFEKLDNNSLKITYRSKKLYNYIDSNDYSNYNLLIDNENDLWIYSRSHAKGLFYFDLSKEALFHINKDSKKFKTNNNIITGILQDKNGLIWIGTDHGGVNILNKKDFSVQYIMNHPFDLTSLSQNSVQTMYQDVNDMIWLGTFKKGVSYYHESLFKFKLYKNNPSDPESLPFDDINCFEEDEKGNLWIGTNGGGLVYFDRKNNSFNQYKHDPDNANSLRSDVIVCLLYDHDNKLWIGTFYGGLNYYDGNKFLHYRHDPENPHSLANDNVWDVYEDSQNNLWIGTLGDGLDLFDRDKKIFYHYRAGEFNSVSSDFIISISGSKGDNIYLATPYGMNILNIKTGRFNVCLAESGNPESLSTNSILTILEDSRDMIWIGTRDGLNLFNRENGKFRVFRTSEGLPDNVIQTIIEDNLGNLWIGSTNGLTNLVLDYNSIANDYGFIFNNYDESDGLQGMEFNEKAVFKTKKGELLFGGSEGFNLFNPEDIKITDFTPEIVFTEFQIFNNSIEVGELVNGRVILNKSFNNTQEIYLKYKENIISIEFAALNFLQPEKMHYQYMLEGFNEYWLDADSKSRKATFTNLDPGEYTFRIRVTNNYNTWSKEGKSLKINILPPIWLTNFALVVYGIFILGLLLLLRLIVLKRERLKFKNEQEKLEAQRRHELDMMKIKFFTNISHEFRTPLSLIITPLQKILKNTRDSEQKRQFELIHRNAKRLLHLVSQLLDFRKMEVQKISLNLMRGDFIKFAKDVFISFTDLAEIKNIQYSFQSNVDELYTNFDHDKIEKVLFNLLSNAFKFTHEKDSIKLALKYIEEDKNIELLNRTSSKFLEIKVIDTGIGIPEEKKEKIFQRFFQDDNQEGYVNKGSGIGLSLTKEFVKLHQGDINVISEPGKGSCFIVQLPVDTTDILKSDDNISIEIKHDIKVEEDEIIGHQKDISKKPTLLIVEDNEDFRFYLKDNLKNEYNVLEASNGFEGWRVVLESSPDLVVSDLMMPEMDGLELCNKIKTDQRTSHIPIILLTARTADQQKKEGFETGADDYITKPFNFEIFELRLKNLIKQREALRKLFQKQIEIEPSEISVTPLDELFIKKAIEEVEENMSNPEYSVTELSRELNMSRTTLYKKLLALTGKTPIEFIRILRLKRAAQLLGQSQLSVSEIAYKVGFNDTRYFTKYFKTEFKELPSVYAAANKKENDRKFKI